ncbi:response regulator [Tepidamorphus sp. 3E244]|uniref:response regulator n=1 Tax=Tepidamorphus sp. 3E244 TaxID=3385498 RepID=UPI0038FCB45D
MARIVLVEDDDSVRSFVARALERDGHEVTTAMDGGEGLDVLRERAHATDLLLTDIQMPVMDGIALALNVAREWPDLPIVLMTGYAHQRERAHGLESLICDVIQKPFTLAEISKRVNAALEGSMSQEQSALSA